MNGRIKVSRLCGLAWGLGLCLLSSRPASAQSFEVDWWSQDGGGGTVSGATFDLGFTMGQPDAGAAVGGPFALTSGFWAIASTTIQPTPRPTPTGVPTPTPIPVTVPAEGRDEVHFASLVAVFAALAFIALRRSRDSSDSIRQGGEEE